MLWNHQQTRLIRLSFHKWCHNWYASKFCIVPSATLFPEKSNVAHTFAFYETLNFQEYFVKPMQRVQIRQDENDIGVTVGSGQNKYIIQSNMFAQGIVPSVAEAIGNNILKN